MLIINFILFNFFVILLLLIIRFFNYMYKILIKNENTTDIHFKGNTWENNYMFGVFDYTKKNKNSFEKYIKRFKSRTKIWEKNMNWYKEYNVRGIFEINETNTFDEILNTLKITKPPVFKSTVLPYKMLFLKKEFKIIMLLNHYHCDGIILHDMIIHNITNTEKTINFIKYRYFPIISDLLLYKFLMKMLYNKLFTKHEYLRLDDKKSVVALNKITYNTKINRWIVYSKIINTLFKYLKKDSIKVAFTVGFDDTVYFCKNRIGVIIVTIPKMNDESEYLNYIKKMILKYNSDAICSYDLCRNFPIHLLRKNLDKTIDIVLTAFKIDGKDKNDCDLKNISYNVGSFLGIGRIPIYICSITLDYDKIVNVCIKSTTPDLDIDKMIENEPSTTKLYEW